MSFAITKKETLEELAQKENIVLKKFSTSLAWELGTLARKLAQEFNKPILIDITLATGQIAFHSASSDGTTVDNDIWVERKKKSVLRFGYSSYYLGQKLAAKQKANSAATAETALFIDPLQYATHGGSVPIRIAGLDAIVGALTISGLAQEEDHSFALRVLTEFNETL